MAGQISMRPWHTCPICRASPMPRAADRTAGMSNWAPCNGEREVARPRGNLSYSMPKLNRIPNGIFHLDDNEIFMRLLAINKEYSHILIWFHYIVITIQEQVKKLMETCSQRVVAMVYKLNCVFYRIARGCDLGQIFMPPCVDVQIMSQQLFLILAATSNCLITYLFVHLSVCHCLI